MKRGIFSLTSVVTIISAFAIGHAQADHLSVSLTVDPTATLSTDRIVVTVRGTVTCGPLLPPDIPGLDFGNIFLVMRQASGRSITQGLGFFEPLCDGTSERFESLVPADQMPWHGGLARVNASANVQDCNEFFQCENAFSTVDTQIKVRGGQPM